MVGGTNQHATPIFEMHRRLIDESQHLLTQSVEAQRLSNRLLLRALKGQVMAQRNSVEMANSFVHGYLDGATATLPGENDTDRLHELVDEQFDQILEIHANTFGVFKDQVERSIDTYEELSAGYVDSVDDSFDSLLDTHHQFETQSIELVDHAEKQTDLEPTDA